MVQANLEKVGNRRAVNPHMAIHRGNVSSKAIAMKKVKGDNQRQRYR